MKMSCCIWSIRRWVCLACLAFLVSDRSNGRGNTVAASSKVAPPYPSEITETQPDGTKFSLYLKGHPHYGAFQTDVLGHPVLRNLDGWFVYADYDGEAEAAVPPIVVLDTPPAQRTTLNKRRKLSYSLNKVGVDKPPARKPPSLQSLIPHGMNMPSMKQFHHGDNNETASFIEGELLAIRDKLCEGAEQSPWCPNSNITSASNTQFGRAGTQALGRGNTIIPDDLGGQLNLIVLLVQFSDQASRPLASKTDYEKLFNGNDGSVSTTSASGETIIPTGSVREYFNIQSAGRMEVNAYVQDWVVANNTEEVWSFGFHGLTYMFAQCAYEALDRMDANGADWSMFDRDNVSSFLFEGRTCSVCES